MSRWAGPGQNLPKIPSILHVNISLF